MTEKEQTAYKVVDWKISMAIIWLIFTVSLSIWWTRLGLQYIGPKKGMILGEGVTLIICLTIGGIVLIRYIVRERQKNKEINSFFASANHELKTYTASIRLRAEGLEQDLADSNLSADAQKIVRDTVRLEVQLENSLIFSEPGKKQIFIEDISFANFAKNIHSSLSSGAIVITGDLKIAADKRMLTIILKNIFQNALVHAKASTLYISARQDPKGKVVEISSDGEPFRGTLEKCGVMFYRHQHNSRSGIGLYLVKMLMKCMNHQVHFRTDEHDRFVVELTFSGGSQ